MTTLRSHFRFIWRHLLKDGRFTIINLAGLTLGLAATIMIFLWV